MAFRTLKNIEMLTKSPRRIKKRNKCILYVFSDRCEKIDKNVLSDKNSMRAPKAFGIVCKNIRTFAAIQ